MKFSILLWSLGLMWFLYSGYLPGVIIAAAWIAIASVLRGGHRQKTHLKHLNGILRDPKK